MTSEGLENMFEGDPADMCTDGGLSGGSRVRRPGSEDPHRRERKLIIKFVNFFTPRHVCWKISLGAEHQRDKRAQTREPILNYKTSLYGAAKYLYIKLLAQYCQAYPKFKH